MESRVCIDFSWVLHRSFHAHNMLSVIINEQVVPTGVFFGSTQSLQSIKIRRPNAEIIFCIDSQSNEDRKEMLPGYKANRPNSDVVHNQTEDAIAILANVPGVKFAIANGKEADDVMASLALEAINQGKESLVFSGDNDMLQLIPQGAKIFRKFKPGDFEYITDEYTLNKYGVSLRHLPYFRAIAGDPSDEIPPAIKRLDKEFIRVFVDAWINSDFNQALKKVALGYPRQAARLNTKEVREAIHRNAKLMVLTGYRTKPLENIQYLDVTPRRDLMLKYRLFTFKGFVDVLVRNG